MRLLVSVGGALAITGVRGGLWVTSDPVLGWPIAGSRRGSVFTNLEPGTPLHDHAGIWCVECVYTGRIRVTSYNCHGGDPEHNIVHFKQETVIHAGVGEAGALIPPFEYHVLENASDAPSVTLHVYGGELDHCHVFEPMDGGWLRKYRELTYTV